jgi:hypothetical protein
VIAVHSKLLEHSPLLALPLAALFIFLTVFLAVIARTMSRRPREYQAAADLPLAEDEESRHDR